MTKLKLIILIVLVTVITLLIGTLQPSMHKQAVIVDSNYKFVEDVTETVPSKITPIEVKNKEIPVTTKKVEMKSSPTKIKQTPVKLQSNNVKTTQAPTKVVKASVEPKTLKTIPKQKATQKTETKKETKSPIVVDKPVTVPTPVVKVEPQTEPKKLQQKVLTEQEEIIVWNKWRSDLQNQVMRDTKIAAPMGTGFKFSFTVDKYGNMSNVKVWSTNSVYTDLAVRVIKPVLMSYQRKPILNFPEGTKRVITNVNGGFYIATTTEYSTPSDYSDYEKVRK